MSGNESRACPGQIEDQLLIKFPPSLAKKIKQHLKNKALPKFKIIPDPESKDERGVIREFQIIVGDYPSLKGHLIDLPCVIETQKTLNRKYYYKCGDISQVIMVQEEGDETPLTQIADLADNPAEFDHLRYQSVSGLTPPAYRCRKRWVARGDVENIICRCEGQASEVCERCGAIPRERVKHASEKLFHMMKAEPTETFRIIIKEVDPEASVTRMMIDRTVGRTPGNVINVSNKTPTGTFDNNSPFVGQPGMNPKLQQPPHKVPKTIHKPSQVNNPFQQRGRDPNQAKYESNLRKLKEALGRCQDVRRQKLIQEQIDLLLKANFSSISSHRRTM